jgi:CheY-like chemotaxis protein
VVVAVCDDGIGIPADMLASVFEMFVQAQRALESSRGGLGIGLTLVKRLVEMHGGSVHAYSEPGRGSELIVRLPRAAEPVHEASAPGPRLQAGAGFRVMVVDDNRDSAETMAMLLELLGHEIRVAHDGLQALELAEQFRPHALLLDIGMPRLNGYEVCSRLRKQLWGRDMLLIAVTGWGQETDQRRSREAGFDAHLVKPVEPLALQDALARLAGRFARQR